MSLYKNKYRIESIRSNDWNYTTPWWYYVTINTKKHISYFGKIKKGKMILNQAGELVAKEWERTKAIRNNIDLDYYVVMPNHIHGIIIINNPVETTRRVVSKATAVPIDSSKNNDVETLQNQNETTQRVVSTTLKSNSLGSVIGQIKSVCTKQIRAMGYNDFAWQAGYYERIIRNEKELYRIRKYIEENPMRWECEKNISENLNI